jgi:hypothetical protein
MTQGRACESLALGRTDVCSWIWRRSSGRSLDYEWAKQSLAEKEGQEGADVGKALALD